MLDDVYAFRSPIGVPEELKTWSPCFLCGSAQTDRKQKLMLLVAMTTRPLPISLLFPLYKKTIMQTQRTDEPWDFPASTPSRPDWHTARFVKQGIRMQSIHGTGYAANFLRNRRVDIDVALRVLLQPARRRNYDQQ
jgi:hypothetical protein